MSAPRGGEGGGGHLTPASPTMPIAMPAARPASPQARPAARCAYPSNRKYGALTASDSTRWPHHHQLTSTSSLAPHCPLLALQWRIGMRALQLRRFRCGDALQCMCSRVHGTSDRSERHKHPAQAGNCGRRQTGRIWCSGRQRTASADDDGDDEAVNTQHPRHDNGHDGLHHQLRPAQTGALGVSSLLLTPPPPPHHHQITQHGRLTYPDARQLK